MATKGSKAAVPPTGGLFDATTSSIDADGEVSPLQGTINSNVVRNALTSSGAGLAQSVLSITTAKLRKVAGDKFKEDSQSVGVASANTLAAIADEMGGVKNNVNTILNFMDDVVKKNAASATDMFDPSRAYNTALALVEGRGSIYNFTEYGDGVKSVSDGYAEEDFIQQLMGNGVSQEQAYAAADAINYNKDDNITDKEMDTYASSQNSVVAKIIKDPRFRNRLVKRKPYQSIYGDNYSSQYNQTDIAEQGAALDNDSYNVSNVVYDD